MAILELDQTATPYTIRGKVREYVLSGQILPWLLLVTGIILTYVACIATVTTSQKEVQLEFNAKVKEILTNIDRRMDAQEQVLRSAEGLFAASPLVDRNAFRSFVSALKLGKNYPGIQGVGFSTLIRPNEKEKHIAAVRKEGFPQYAIRPEGQRDTYTSIIYLEPFDWRNKRAFGYDMFSEPTRRAAMTYAWDTGEVSISGKVTLLQETQKNTQPGFLMYLPIYRQGLPHDTRETRHANLMGWAYLPLRSYDLMSATLGVDNPNIAIQIYDGTKVSKDTLLYDVHSEALPAHRESLFKTTHSLRLYGHDWLVEISALPTFSAASIQHKTIQVGVTGITITLLLTTLSWLLAHGRSRALAIAREMNHELIESESRFRTMANSAPVMIWVAGTDRLCIWFNQIWLDFTGRSMAQKIGNGWTGGVHPDDYQRCLETYLSHSERQETFRTEFRLRRHDGEYRWISNHGVPRVDDQGHFTGYIGSCTDIHELKMLEESLRLSEERWHFALEGSGQGVWDWDVQASQVMFSKRWKEMLGYAEEDIGNSLDEWEKRVHPDDKPQVMADLRAYFSHTTPFYENEHRVLCKDGSWKWILDRGMVCEWSAEDKPLRMIGTHTDISQRKTFELFLKKNEEDLRAASSYARSLIEASLDPLVTISAEGKITDVNRATERVTGCTREEFIGTSFPIYFTEPELAQKGYQQVFTDGFVKDYPLSIHHKSGQITDVLYNASLFRNEAGVIQGVFAAARDVSRQKMIEEALRENQNRLLHMLETSPIAVRIAAAGGSRVLFANQRYAELINAEPHQVIGTNPKNYYATPHDYDDVLKRIEEGETVIDKLVELHVPGDITKGFSGHNPGDRITWAMASYLKMDYQGEPAVLGWFYDVTDLRKAKEMAEEVARTKAEFLANMSHEIRTPMNAIIGLSHLALNKEVSPEIRDYLEKIQSSSDSLLSILNDILDLSKTEAGRMTISRKAFDLDFVTRNLRNLFSHRAQEKLLNFEIKVAKDVPRYLVGDALRLQQILTNLLGNALKFTEHGSVTLTISLKKMEPAHASLLFSVMDTGIGISKNDQAKLFKPFSQVDGSMTRRF